MSEPAGDGAPGGETDDYKFYRGTIERLFEGRRAGVVRSGNGRRIPFELPYVVLAGAARRFADLRVGMRVGFDVGWTEGGLRVTVLHLPELGRSRQGSGPAEIPATATKGSDR